MSVKWLLIVLGVGVVLVMLALAYLVLRPPEPRDEILWGPELPLDTPAPPKPLAPVRIEGDRVPIKGARTLLVRNLEPKMTVRVEISDDARIRFNSRPWSVVRGVGKTPTPWIELSPQARRFELAMVGVEDVVVLEISSTELRVAKGATLFEPFDAETWW